MVQRLPPTRSSLALWLFVSCAAALLTTPSLLDAALAPGGARGAEPTDPDAIAIDRRLTEAEAEGLDGVILIRHGDRILLHRAYGWRDREAQQAMTVEVGFDLHMTFFTSSARHKVEDLWPEFREHVFAIARRESDGGSSAGSRPDAAR